MIRLDQLLVDRGLMRSRARAGTHIRQHGVLVAGKEVRKPGKKFPEDVTIELLGDVMPWVGRGALKLLHAVQIWNIALKDIVGLDIGSSTGGFTEVMLHHGARKVYAVDTGTDQLDPTLRTDERVVVMEQTDIRDVTPEMLEPSDFFAVDVSFISLRLVMPSVPRLCAPSAQGVVLVKPQFEVGKDQVGKGGIVRDDRVRSACISSVSAFISSLGFEVLGDCPSPIQGGDGNREHLLWLKRASASA